jgi:hypothetical protein
MTNDLPAFDELKNIRASLAPLVSEAVADAANGKRINRRRFEDIIFELLTMGYVYGIEVAGLDLETDLPVRRERMFEVAEAPTKGENFAERTQNRITEAEEALTTESPDAVAQRLTDQLATIAETETHRVINTGSLDGAGEYTRQHPDAAVYKTWITAGDERVRDSHDYLEGATVPLDARFYTYDGDSTLEPGGFMFAENNVNCRCILRYTKN